jgi:hypothetical protein
LAAVLCAGVPVAHAAGDPSFVLTATAQDFGGYTPTLLANGYLSTLSGPRGTEAARAYLVGFMDYTADDVSRPAAIPGWTTIDYSTGPTPTGQAWLDKVPLDAARFEDYRQTLDLHEATLTTAYVYVDGARRTRIEVTTFVDQADPHLAASRFSITPDFDGTVELSFALTLWTAHQPRLPLAQLTGPQMEELLEAQGQSLAPAPPPTPDRAAIWYPGSTRVSAPEVDADELSLSLNGRAEQGLAMAEAASIGLPPDLKPVSVTVERGPYRLALNLRVAVRRQQTYVFSKFVAVSREGWGGDAAQDRRLAAAARNLGFEALLALHRGAWEQLWQTDIRIDGDPQAQQVVHSELYYLLSNSTADTAWPLGACAMTPGYTGHAFWDSDTWIFPALLLLHPERAKSLVRFRDRTLGAAQARARAHGYAGAMFPWESDPENGSEQTPHFAQVLGEREIHVNADIAIAQWQYYLATLDRDWLKREGWPVIRDVANFWASRATYVADHRRYEILHVTSVDEPYNDIPNDTFTNVSAARALALAGEAAAVVGERADPHWSTVARGMYVPTGGAPLHHLEFDPSVAVAEGAGFSSVLLTYPSLDLPMSDALRRSDYAASMPPQIDAAAVGNSMGFAPNSIMAATVGDAPAAAAWFDGNFTGGTLLGPFKVRSETARNNTDYFLTASGGYVQNLVYGFTGLRIRSDGLVQAYAPLLPAAWRRLTLQNVAFRGRRYDVSVFRDAAGRVRLEQHPR